MALAAGPRRLLGRRRRHGPTTTVATTVVHGHESEHRRPDHDHDPGDDRTLPRPRPPTTSAATAPATTTRWHRPGGSASCPAATASAPSAASSAYWVHRGDPTKVMLYFQGGGACFSADTCRPGSGAYKASTGAEDDPSLRPAGLLALDDPRNPVAGWSIVFVPYCTGDVFLGNDDHEYSPDVTIHHNGAVNARAALDRAGRDVPGHHPAARHRRERRRRCPTPLVAGEAHDALPERQRHRPRRQLGRLPRRPGRSTPPSGRCGGRSTPCAAVARVRRRRPPSSTASPACSSSPATTTRRSASPATTTRSTRRRPSSAALAGFDAGNLVQLIDQNEQEIEAGGVDVAGLRGARHRATR